MTMRLACIIENLKTLIKHSKVLKSTKRKEEKERMINYNQNINLNHYDLLKCRLLTLC